MNILISFIIFMNENEFDDSITNVWMNLEIKDLNDYLFLL